MLSLLKEKEILLDPKLFYLLLNLCYSATAWPQRMYKMFPCFNATIFIPCRILEIHSFETLIAKEVNTNESLLLLVSIHATHLMTHGFAITSRVPNLTSCFRHLCTFQHMLHAYISFSTETSIYYLLNL